MAVALDGTTVVGNTGFGSSVDTGANVTTAGTNRLLVANVTFLNVTGGTVTGGGLTWTKAVQAINSSAQFTSELWWAWAAAAITNQTVTASGLSGAANLSIAVQAFSGSRDYTGLVANTDFTTASAIADNGTASSVNVTTKANGSFIVSGTETYDSVGSTPPVSAANCTKLGDGVPGGGGGAFVFNYLTASPAAIGTYAVGSTHEDNGWGLAAMEILAAVVAAVGGVPPRRPSRRFNPRTLTRR